MRHSSGSSLLDARTRRRTLASPRAGIAERVALGRRGIVSVSITGPSTQASPVLLLRPLGGSMALWGRFADTLAEEVRVIAFDPRGVGRSSALPWRCSTREMARDAVALLDTLGFPRAHVFGLSLGGMVAEWIAVDSPERVESLVLASTLPHMNSISRRVKNHILPVLSAAAEHGAEAEVALVRALLSPQFRDREPERVRAIEATIRAAPTKRRTLLTFALAGALHSAEARLAPHSGRTLLLFGEHDWIVGQTSRNELARDIPNAVVEILPGAGHDLSLERPVETARRVLRFLSGSDASTTNARAMQPRGAVASSR